MSSKCRHVNATSTQRLPACLQEALRALLARRTSPFLELFFNIADRLYLFFTQISPTEPTCTLQHYPNQDPKKHVVFGSYLEYILCSDRIENDHGLIQTPHRDSCICRRLLPQEHSRYAGNGSHGHELWPSGRYRSTSIQRRPRCQTPASALGDCNGRSPMPPQTNPRVLEAAKQILDGEDCTTAPAAVGHDLSKKVRRNMIKKVSAARKQLDACRPPADPERLSALHKTAD